VVASGLWKGKQDVVVWQGCQPYVPLPRNVSFSDSGTNFCSNLSKIQGLVRLEGLGKLENSFTSSGLEPATFQLVAQCLSVDINKSMYSHVSRKVQPNRTLQVSLSGSTVNKEATSLAMG
jgi:hypothetical protein